MVEEKFTYVKASCRDQQDSRRNLAPSGCTNLKDTSKKELKNEGPGRSGNCTVMLIEMPCFSVAKLLLHHYNSDLAHTSDRYSSVIELYLS